MPEWLLKFDKSVGDYFRFYGAIRRCTPAHWWRAFTEIAITLVFALLPLWVPLFAFPMFGKLDLGIAKIIGEQVKNGELYLIATGLLAPIYYFSFPTARVGAQDKIQPFPSQQIILLIFLATICISVVAITATKVQAVGPQGIPQRMINWSWWLFAFCCAVYLLTLTVKNSMDEITERVLDENSRNTDRMYPIVGQNIDNQSPIDPDEMINDIINQHKVG